MKVNDDVFKKFNAWRDNWVDKSSISIIDYINFNIDPNDLIIIGKLFFPDFVEVDGSVFLKEKYTRENYLMWLKDIEDPVEIEKVINHVHIYDLFSNTEYDVEEFIFEEVAKILAFSWRLCLDSFFKEKKFNVIYSNTDKDYGPTITFYQQKR